jgi:hypothetical protein
MSTEDMNDNDRDAPLCGGGDLPPLRAACEETPPALGSSGCCLSFIFCLLPFAMVEKEG